MFCNTGPDVLGLAEVQNDSVLLEITKRLPWKYKIFFSNSLDPKLTGLGMIVRDGVFKTTEQVDVQKPLIMARPRCFVAECKFSRKSDKILLVVNHWKSRYQRRGSVFTDSADREQTARWLGDLIARYPPRTCVIVIGDFNTEPCDSVFSESKMRTVRTFSKLLWSKSSPVYLYNTAWKFIIEPNHWEDTQQPGFRETRPKTTMPEPNLIFDQLLVSGAAFKDGPLKFMESSLSYCCVGTQKFVGGSLRPKRWSFLQGIADGCSDHFPIMAQFEIVGD